MIGCGKSGKPGKAGGKAGRGKPGNKRNLADDCCREDKDYIICAKDDPDEFVSNDMMGEDRTFFGNNGVVVMIDVSSPDYDTSNDNGEYQTP